MPGGRTLDKNDRKAIFRLILFSFFASLFLISEVATAKSSHSWTAVEGDPTSRDPYNIVVYVDKSSRKTLDDGSTEMNTMTDYGDSAQSAQTFGLSTIDTYRLYCSQNKIAPISSVWHSGHLGRGNITKVDNGTAVPFEVSESVGSSINAIYKSACHTSSNPGASAAKSETSISNETSQSNKSRNSVTDFIAYCILFLILLYFIPSIIAFMRKHRQKYAILAANLFLGWSVIGWVFSLIWSLTSPNNNVQQTVIVQQTAANITPPTDTAPDTQIKKDSPFKI